MGDGEQKSAQELAERLQQLEWENRRLRDAVQEAGLPADVAAWFDPAEFRRVVNRAQMLIGVGGTVAIMGFMLVFFFLPDVLPRVNLGPMPLFDLGGMRSGFFGFGFGVFAVGGLSIGGVAMGGGAVGLVAFGGGAMGIVATGGGAVGFIAIGGGAVGYIAIGGSAFGKYVLAEHGRGTHVLALNRQDEEAAHFFRRFIPGLGRAVSRPLPVMQAEAI
ncbi:MAG: hypothetical protein AAGI46_02805 [Planctomycetota bacterium]